MPKKRVNADSSSAGNKISKEKYEELQEKLVENLVELQKVHTNLAERFDKLSDQITTLLRLFEMAAKSFASVPGNVTSEKDKDFLDKIDRLLDQNKTIAKGLMLIEEKVRERMYGMPIQNQMPSSSPPQYNNQNIAQPQYNQNTAPQPSAQQAPPLQTPSEPNDDTIQPSVITRPLPKF
ncbi:MAG: hypothetical protein Q8Q31_05945 [Nanoarchaeota archaeon]|nr:hypothetical protein [Nanoarchaeota archaeon]